MAFSFQTIHSYGARRSLRQRLAARSRAARDPSAEVGMTRLQAIQLRYLETLTVIGADKNTTNVFPLPMDIVGPLLSALPSRDKPAP